MNILGLSMMSVAIFMYGVIPLFADLNRTHATNPKWPKHARFHVVTQVLTTAGVAAISLVLLWSPNIERRLGVGIAAALSFVVLAAFFASAASRSLYGGGLGDEEGGIPKIKKIDLNTLNFGTAALLLIIGWIVFSWKSA